MNNVEKLEKIFTAEFVEQNADLDSVDAIYGKVSEIDSSISKNDVEEFLAAVSEVMQKKELDAEELDDVSGGIGLLAIAAGITAVAGVFGATYGIGTAIGRCVYNIKHW